MRQSHHESRPGEIACNVMLAARRDYHFLWFCHRSCNSCPFAFTSAKKDSAQNALPFCRAVALKTTNFHPLEISECQSSDFSFHSIEQEGIVHPGDMMDSSHQSRPDTIEVFSFDFKNPRKLSCRISQITTPSDWVDYP